MSILEQTSRTYNSNNLPASEAVTSMAMVEYFNQSVSPQNSAPTDPARNTFVHNCANSLETPIELKFRRLYQSKKWLSYADRLLPERQRRFKQTLNAFYSPISNAENVIGVQEIDANGEISSSLRNLQTTKFRGDPVGAERRAIDDYKVIKAIDERMQARGGLIMMITLTVHHRKDTPLSQTTQVLKDAWRGLRRSGNIKRTYSRLMDEIGYLGGFRMFADTIGNHGFHRHLHVGYCIDEKPSDEWITAIKELWRESVKSAGGWASMGHGIEVSFPPDVADYMRKQSGWGLAEEFTMDRFKSGQSIHPLQLLDMPDSEWARDTYIEWAESMVRFRVFQLLNDILEELDLDKDTILAEEEIEQETIVCVLPHQLWQHVRRLNIIAELSQAIGEGEREVWELLYTYRDHEKIQNKTEYLNAIDYAREHTKRHRAWGLSAGVKHDPDNDPNDEKITMTLHEDPDTGRLYWEVHD